MANPKGKFGSIFQAAQIPEEPAPLTVNDENAVETAPLPAAPKRASARPSLRGGPEHGREPSLTARARGKSASTDFRPVTAYLRRETHDNAKRLLIGADEDLSELLERLLSNWVARKTDPSQ
jgi:hypothetical protein